MERIGPWSVAESDIEGLGVFAKRRFLAGEVVGECVVDGLRTQLGRFVNHSAYPNTNYVQSESGCALVALRSIDKDQEITTNYRYSPAMRSLLCQER